MVEVCGEVMQAATVCREGLQMEVCAEGLQAGDGLQGGTVSAEGLRGEIAGVRSVFISASSPNLDFVFVYRLNKSSDSQSYARFGDLSELS